MSGLGLIAHGPKIQCFGPTIGLHKIINFYTIFMNLLTYLLTYNLASLSGPNNTRARAQLTLSLIK
jgi:hypothetical protein